MKPGDTTRLVASMVAWPVSGSVLMAVIGAPSMPTLATPS